MKYHLIVGNGKWGSKVLDFLKKKKKYRIIVKTRFKYIDFKTNKRISLNNINKNNIKSIHICSPVDSHYYYLKKFSNINKILVEKPFLKNLLQLNKIKKLYKKKYLLVDYIDTFNPILIKAKQTLKNSKPKKIIFDYSNTKKFYKKKFEFSYEWLDHPLSLILYLFKKFPKFVIKNIIIIKNKKKFHEKVIINYLFKNFKVSIKLNCSKKIKREIKIYQEKSIKKFLLYENKIYKNNIKVYQAKLTSFDNLYNYLEKRKKLNYQNFSFHEMIMREKQKVIKELKNKV